MTSVSLDFREPHHWNKWRTLGWTKHVKIVWWASGSLACDEIIACFCCSGQPSDDSCTFNNPSQQQLSLLGLKESPRDLCPIVGFRRDLGELRGSKREHKLALSQSALEGFLLTNLWVWSLNMPVGSLGLLQNNFYISFFFPVLVDVCICSDLQKSSRCRW